MIALLLSSAVIEAVFNNNSIHLFVCLAVAKQGQLQPSIKTTV
jgi:hypothetical protein